MTTYCVYKDYDKIGIAESYESIVEGLLECGWLEKNSPEGRLVDGLGEDWLAKILSWSVEKFNIFFVGYFSIEIEKV